MQGFHFTEYIPEKDKRTPFERLLEIFLELLTYTSGDVDETLEWMRELDKQHNLTNENYTIDDFIEDLFEKGYLSDGSGTSGGNALTGKTEQAIRRRSLDQIFGKLRKGERGGHTTPHSGSGDEATGESRPYRFGDSLDSIDFTESIRNAQQRGLEGLNLSEDDLEVREKEHKSSVSTVLMIDISHSMILYGEDRITPAKKVAMALAEFIITRYPKDTLDIVVFGNDAWQVSIKDLPYLKVGPYHTNTVAGLRLAMDLLRRRKTSNKQIFMITDGKPSCLKVKDGYYKNSFGLDPVIVNKCLNLATECRKLKIPITTFMIAEDPYLQRFVEDFTKANSGRAVYTGLSGLGEWIFNDYERNRKKRA